jgi:hypothetical protein
MKQCLCLVGFRSEIDTLAGGAASDEFCHRDGRLRSSERQTQLSGWGQEEGEGEEDDEEEEEEQDEEHGEEESVQSDSVYSSEDCEEEDEGGTRERRHTARALAEGGAGAFGGGALGGQGDWGQLERALRDAQDEVLQLLVLPGAGRSFKFEARRTDCPTAAGPGAAGQQLASASAAAAAVEAVAMASVAAATEAALLQGPPGGPEETLSELALAVSTLRSAAAPAGRQEVGELPSRAGAALATSPAASARSTSAGVGGGSFIFSPPGSSPVASPMTLLSPTAGSSGAFVFGAPQHIL